MFCRFLAGLSAIAISAIVARSLPEEMAATFFLAMSIANFLLFWTTLGFDRAALRFVAENRANSPETARRTVRLAILTTIISSLAVVALVSSPIGRLIAERALGSPSLASFILFVGVWGVLRAILSTISESLRGLHRVIPAAMFSGAADRFLCLVVLIPLYFFARREISLNTIFHIVICALVFSILCGGFLLWKYVPSSRERPPRPIFGKMWTVAWPIWITMLLIFVTTRANMWILSSCRAPREVALFGAALQISQVMVLALQVVNAVLPSYVAESFAAGRRQAVERLLRTSAFCVAIPALLFLVLFATCGRPLLEMAFGASYAGGYFTLLMLVIAHCINAMTGSPGILMNMTGHQRAVLVLIGISALTGLSVSVVTVERWGGGGTALGAAIGIVLTNVGMMLYSRVRLGIRTYSYCSPKDIQNTCKLLVQIARSKNRLPTAAMHSDTDTQ